MANKYIEESLEEAKGYLNKVEESGEPMLHIAERILESCKAFMHQPETKQYEDYLQKLDTEFSLKLREAKEKNDSEKDSFMKYYSMAQFVINLNVEKIQRIMNYLDRLNQKL